MSIAETGGSGNRVHSGGFDRVSSRVVSRRECRVDSGPATSTARISERAPVVSGPTTPAARITESTPVVSGPTTPTARISEIRHQTSRVQTPGGEAVLAPASEVKPAAITVKDTPTIPDSKPRTSVYGPFRDAYDEPPVDTTVVSSSGGSNAREGEPPEIVVEQTRGEKARSALDTAVDVATSPGILLPATLGVGALAVSHPEQVDRVVGALSHPDPKVVVGTVAATTVVGIGASAWNRYLKGIQRSDKPAPSDTLYGVAAAAPLAHPQVLDGLSTLAHDPKFLVGGAVVFALGTVLPVNQMMSEFGNSAMEIVNRDKSQPTPRHARRKPDSTELIGSLPRSIKDAVVNVPGLAKRTAERAQLNVKDALGGDLSAVFNRFPISSDEVVKLEDRYRTLYSPSRLGISQYYTLTNFAKFGTLATVTSAIESAGITVPPAVAGVIIIGSSRKDFKTAKKEVKQTQDDMRLWNFNRAAAIGGAKMGGFKLLFGSAGIGTSSLAISESFDVPRGTTSLTLWTVTGGLLWDGTRSLRRERVRAQITNRYDNRKDKLLARGNATLKRYNDLTKRLDSETDPSKAAKLRGEKDETFNRLLVLTKAGYDGKAKFPHFAAETKEHGTIYVPQGEWLHGKSS